MIVRTLQHPGWLANSYVVADRPGGAALIIDTGAPPRRILAQVRELGVRVARILNTHHHHDHVAGNEALRRATGAPVWAPAAEAERIPAVDETMEPGEAFAAGELRARILALPGHTPAQVGVLVQDAAVFTADCLFRGSVGGTAALGARGFALQRRAILDTLMALPPEVAVYPGHADASTVGQERQGNPFIRVWRGLDPEGDDPCTVSGRPARLVVWARDYDGGHKAWVRFPDGSDVIVPGSQVSRP